MNKLQESQSKAIKGKAMEEPYGGKAGGETCEHGLEKKKCKECSKEYHENEKGEKSHGKESLKTRKDMIHKRVKGLDEKEGTLPVFSRSKKGLKFRHMSLKK